jgi:hypothetical protein
LDKLLEWQACYEKATGSYWELPFFEAARYKKKLHSDVGKRNTTVKPFR